MLTLNSLGRGVEAAPRKIFAGKAAPLADSRGDIGRCGFPTGTSVL